MMHPRDEIFYSTTPITVTTTGGTAYGTGFFFCFCEKHFGAPAPALVTNKHVLEDAQRLAFPLNLTDDKANPVPGQFEITEVEFEKCAVVDHPSSDVDLCAVLLGPLMGAAMATSGRETALFCATPDSVATEDEVRVLRPLDSVVMIGYPLGLWDDHNNQPISRRGFLATRPALRFQGRPEFLVDLACFPGSSGSPVYLHDLNSYVGTDESTVIGKGRTRLLGVLYAVPMYDAEGALTPSPVPTAAGSMSTEVPAHLGFVIRASEVLALDEPIREFIERRKQRNR